jgi:hypothetical protein
MHNLSIWRAITFRNLLKCTLIRVSLVVAIRIQFIGQSIQALTVQRSRAFPDDPCCTDGCALQNAEV